MNKSRKLAAALCVTAVVSAIGIGAAFAQETGFTTLPSISQESTEEAPALSMLGIHASGTLTKMENGQVRVSTDDPNAVHPEIILNITDETRILDAVNGFPVNAADLKDGEFVYVYTAGFMTMSIPPQTNATVLICQVPQDAAAPQFQVIQSAEMSSDGTSAEITTVEGDRFIVDQESTLLPYLTRNMIFLDSLQPGKAVLVWKTSEGLDEVGPGVPAARASQVVLFPEEYDITQP